MTELARDHNTLRDELERLQGRLHELRVEIERADGLDENQDAFELLACSAGEQTVAFPLAPVERVVLAAELVPIPGAPAWVSGLLAIPGQNTPVVDVLARFRGAARELDSSDVIVVALVGEQRIGFVVQDASGVCSVPRGELQKYPETGEMAPYVLGTLPVQDRTGWLLSMSALAAPLCTPRCT